MDDDIVLRQRDLPVQQDDGVEDELPQVVLPDSLIGVLDEINELFLYPRIDVVFKYIAEIRTRIKLPQPIRTIRHEIHDRRFIVGREVK